MNQELLKSLLFYDPSTGDFTRPSGKRAGTTRPDGYRQISINKRLYLAHRLAYLYMTGEWPEQIDHRDNCRSNNRWSNLRNATHSQNKMNTSIQSNNSVGLKGVRFVPKRCKYYATIKVNRLSHFLGSFDTSEKAYEAYVEAASKLHGEFACLT